MVQASGIDHIVLHVSDVKRAKDFYTEVLGMTPYRESERQVFLRAGTQGVALFKKEGDTPLTAELEKHGVTVTGRPGEDRCIYFRDPDGHRLQLMTRER